MNALRTVLLSIFFVLHAQVALAQAAPAVRPTSWYAATVAEDEKGGFLRVHFWSKGPLFRAEAILAGRKIVTIVDRTTYYVLDEASGSGIAIERAEATRDLNERGERPFGNELAKLLRQGGELVGSEQAAGQTVDVYRLTNDQGRRTIWVSTTKPSVPLRVETYDRDSATTGKLDYVNWLHNPSLADSFFVPNSNAKMEKLSYERYRRESRKGPLGPAPVLYRHLLHGEN